MEKVKVFQEISGEMERVINKWLKENGDVEITRTNQSQSQAGTSSTTIILTIFYKEKAKPNNDVKAPPFKPIRDNH